MHKIFAIKKLHKSEIQFMIWKFCAQEAAITKVAKHSSNF